MVDAIIAVLSALSVIGMVALTFFRKGKAAAEIAATKEKAKANAETHKRIDHRPPVDPSDHDDNVDRLHKLSGRQ